MLQIKKGSYLPSMLGGSTCEAGAACVSTVALPANAEAEQTSPKSIRTL